MERKKERKKEENLEKIQE